MDNTQKFSGKAEVYRQSRPEYSPQMFTCLQDVFGLSPGCVAADVGSGTGILTHQLLERGVKVYAVEPNADMRRVAEQDLGGFDGFVSVAATAEHTTLPDQSVDFVFAASAFHWFDVAAFRRECERILKPGGRVFLIWNEPKMIEEIQKARREVYEKYSPESVGQAGGRKSRPGAEEEFFDGQIAELHFPNPIIYDKEKFIGRALSSSHALNQSDEHFDKFLVDLGEIFHRFAVEGVIAEAQETVMFFTRDPSLNLTGCA